MLSYSRFHDDCSYLLQLSEEELNRFEVLDALAKTFDENAKSIIINTVRDLSAIVLGNYSLLFAKAGVKERAGLPFDKRCGNRGIHLITHHECSENQFASSFLELNESNYKDILAAAHLYKIAKNKFDGKIITPSLEEVFIFGISAIEGLIELSDSGYTLDWVISDEYDPPLFELSVEELLKKINDNDNLFTNCISGLNVPSSKRSRIKQYLK